ncbi:MAG TPA: HEAT repeat domain-containing protein, partial [Kofleriaceae bacterium]|nr:HEAT repeat domain-containing protein [Kofleriaceae bacterium]
AESTAVDQAPPQLRRDSTRDSVAGSLPRYQGAGTNQRIPHTEPAPPPRRSRLGLYVAIGASVGALASAAYVVLGRGEALKPGAAIASTSAPPGTPTSAAGAQKVVAPEPVPRSIQQALAAGDTAGARALAEQDLRDAIGASSPQRQGFAVDALALAGAPATAPLLYAALRSGDEVRLRAARALGDLGLPDAAPKVRAALAASGERLKVELAAVLVRLGDRDARAIAVRALEDPAQQLTAAAALAEAGDDAGRAVLAGIVEATPRGRDPWRRAAGALARLGDAHARTLLSEELAQPDAVRSVGAAALLARAGDGSARDQLARLAADPELLERGAAATALARLGDKRALGWVATGLASAEASDRRSALAVCGLLAADARAHAATVARLASNDPDPGVRLTAEAVVISLFSL